MTEAENRQNGSNRDGRGAKLEARGNTRLFWRSAPLLCCQLLFCHLALADVSPPPAMLPDASNAALPAARSNLGLGSAVMSFGIRDDSTAAPAAGGTGNAVGDQLTLNDGCGTHGVLTVATVSSGAVLTYNITNRGICATPPANPVGVLSSTGAGSGATFTLNYGPLVAGLKFGTFSTNHGNLFLGGETPNPAYSGTESVFVGDDAGGNLGTGCGFVTAIGHNAIGIGGGATVNTNCSSITAVGADALRNYGGGSAHAAFGSNALKNQSTSTANGMTALGNDAMRFENNANGGNNSTAVGNGACKGSGNDGAPGGSFRQATCLGAATGAALTSANNFTLIGQGTGNTTFASGSDVLLIDSGNNSVDTPAAGSAHMLNVGKVIAGDMGGATNPAVCHIGGRCVLGVLRSANFNITTDQAITIRPMTSGDTGFIAGATAYYISEIYVTNCSASLTTAKGGFYTATSKGGTIIGAITTPFTGCTGSSFTNNAAPMARLTGLTNQDTNLFNAATLQLSLTTAQGGAATGDVYIVGQVVSR